MEVRDTVLSLQQAKELMKLGIDLNNVCSVFIYKKITDCYGKENYELMYFDGITEMFEAGDIATLTSDEMVTAINRFRNWSSSEASIYLPEPNEEYLLSLAELETEKNRDYI